MTRAGRAAGHRWEGAIVYCAGTAWDGFRGTDQHMAQQLSRYAPVLYVDPPTSPVAMWRSGRTKQLLRPLYRRMSPNMARLTPIVVPGHGRRSVHHIARLMFRGYLYLVTRALGGNVHTVVAASILPTFNACRERVRAFYGTDDFVAGASLMGVPVGRTVRDEVRRLQEADVIVAVSPELADKWQGMGFGVDVIPNGVDDETFSRTDDVTPATDVELSKPIAGYFGHLSERIDFRYIEAVADRGCNVLLVGARQPTFDPGRIDGLLQRPNVQWVGERPFASLPSYLRHFDVGLVPYDDTPFNRSSFPLKTLEYLAGGRHVIATDLPAMRWLNTDLIEIAADPEDFACRTERAMRHSPNDYQRADRRAFAATHTWAARAERFATALGIRHGSGDGPVRSHDFTDVA